MIFALSLVPLAIAVGAGLDFSRAMIVRSRLAEALDAAGLAVGASSGLTDTQLSALAQNYFNANYSVDSSYGTPSAVTVVKTSSDVTLTASVQMPTTLMNIVGIKTLDVSFSSNIVWGQTKLWVALVLDNTGSMCEPDSIPCTNDTNPDIKINALKTASHNLLTMLQNAASNPGDVKVSIVPFNRDVNLGSSYYTASWLDWTDWDSKNTTTTYDCSGGGGGGGGGGHGHGFGGYEYNSYAYNGGGSSCTKVTTVNDHSTWNGCITDRNQDYDTKNTTPIDATTAFIPEQYSSCPEQILPLGDDWTALSNEVDGMVAQGNTNQTIGMALGWQTLTDGDPFNAGTLPSGTQRVIILLSDGQNTQNRWTSTQADIDTREELACDNAKAAGVIIYTVFVDLNGTSGNSAPLQYCASDSSKYFDLTTSSAIDTAFNTIGTQITNLRVAK